MSAERLGQRPSVASIALTKDFGSCFSSISNLGSRVTGSDYLNGTRLDALGIPIWTDVYSAGWQTPFDSVEVFLSAHAECV